MYLTAERTMAELGYQPYEDYSAPTYPDPPMSHQGAPYHIEERHPAPPPPGVQDEYTEDRDRQRRRDRDRRRPRDRDRPRHRDRKGDWDRERNRDRYSDEQPPNRPQDGSQGWADNGSWGSESQNQRRYDNQARGPTGGYNDSQNRGGSGYGRQSDDNRSRGREDGGRTGGYAENRTGISSRVSWREEKPAGTILLKALPMDADENMIREEVGEFASYVKDIRLMRKKDTGTSRGFAFVEFHNVSDAQRWMEHNQGSLIMRGGHKVYMHYSNPRGSQGVQTPGRGKSDSQLGVANDWSCVMCGTHNFKKRDRCFKCNVSREVSESTGGVGGADQVGTNPCNTLIFRGLDALTTEDKLIAALSQVTALPIKNTKIMLDSTGVSLGYAFVEMESIRESTQLMETINRLNSPLEVDGKGVIISYAKNTFTTVMASLSQYSQAGSGSGPWSEYYQQPTGTSTSQAYYDEASGQYYDPATGQYMDYSTYYAQQQAADVTTQSDSTNAAAAVAQAAIQQAQAVKNYQKPASESETGTTTTQSATVAGDSQKTETGDDVKYPVPDVSTYTFDESSGYYYDPLTGLYYDASSQYYYNAQNQQFLYWDGEKQNYLPAPNDGQPDGDDRKKEKDKKEKGKFARKIAKDMEKWAKTLNAKKDKMNDFKRAMISGGDMSGKKESAAADAGFAILSKGRFETHKDDMLMPPPALMGVGGAAPTDQPPSGLVASYGGDSDDDDDNNDEDPMQSEEAKLLDWSKMACLLCKRQFPSKEGLQRHVQLSDLHKTKLEELRKTKGIPSPTSQQQMQYRDRAQERRNKYGIADPPSLKKKNRKKAKLEAPVDTSFEQPSHKETLGGENIGNKLLQKMGWNEGQGLGRQGHGRTEPIEAQRRQAQAGLGSTGSRIIADPNDSYRDAGKKMMYSRYNDV